MSDLVWKYTRELSICWPNQVKLPTTNTFPALRLSVDCNAVSLFASHLLSGSVGSCRLASLLTPRSPQNGHQLRSQQQQAGISSFIPQSNAFDNNSYFNLDPSQAAKQMAALSAANQARIANSRAPSAPVPLGGTSSGSYLGGINSSNTAVPHDILSGPMSGSTNFQMSNNHVMSSPANTGVMPLLDPSMSQSTSATRNQMQPTASLRQRQHGFLNGLANVMAKRNTPLPPALTGIPTPNYDPNTTVWKMIEPSPTEVGSFRLAGKDVDLFKLWGLVLQHGGGAAVRQ